MSQSQSDSYSSDSELIRNATPAKTLSEPVKISNALYQGMDGMKIPYRINVHTEYEVVKHKLKFNVSFTGHQTRIEMIFKGEPDLQEIKARLDRLGFLFKKVS